MSRNKYKRKKERAQQKAREGAAQAPFMEQQEKTENLPNGHGSLLKQSQLTA
jgi:hypothetical protein